MWSSDANVSFMVKSYDSEVSLDMVRTPANRELLNELYVKAGTLVMMNDGQCKLAHKVTQVGGKSATAPFGVNFAAAPGSRLAQDSIINVADIIAATTSGTLERVKHILFGYRGGVFRDLDGDCLQVIGSVPTAAGALAF